MPYTLEDRVRAAAKTAATREKENINRSALGGMKEGQGRGMKEEREKHDWQAPLNKVVPLHAFQAPPGHTSAVPALSHTTVKPTDCQAHCITAPAVAVLYN